MKPGQKIHRSVVDLMTQSMRQDNIASGFVNDTVDSSSEMSINLQDAEITDKPEVDLSDKSTAEIQDEFTDDLSYHLPGCYPIQAIRNVNPVLDNSTKSYIPAALLYDNLEWRDIDKKTQEILEDDPYTSAVALFKSAFSPNNLPQENDIDTLSSLASNSKSFSSQVKRSNILLKAFLVHPERCRTSVFTRGAQRCRNALLRDLSTRGRHRMGSQPTSLLFTHNYRRHHGLAGFRIQG